MFFSICHALKVKWGEKVAFKWCLYLRDEWKSADGSFNNYVRRWRGSVESRLGDYDVFFGWVQL